MALSSSYSIQSQINPRLLQAVYIGCVKQNPNISAWPWPHFSRIEVACRHCGQGYYWPAFMNALEDLRTHMARPIIIHSAHRCALHNARVGGAPLSQHLKLAVDISLKRHNLRDLARTARGAGFTGFGFYTTFLHLDMGRPRHWFGGLEARTLWQTYLD
ncbi:D-Ala-D-Ala carboxypeptidase family metallohydrolase [Robiginitomaculum antarcticum]|uniref:D-Ala-D-Ala carboxypeptidase family metallohydrolase n=1 Tax=Robiginitomaculum antarcticum TaxID=437507 RepID=UPI00037C5AFB|nr:D-Ala-D-Ala carboxypeptidase family metallohydrolase [Robiginitomaculum antarcticum]